MSVSPESNLLDRFVSLWKRSRNEQDVPDVFAFLERHPDVGTDERLELLLYDQGRRWHRGEGLRVEDYCRCCPEIASDHRRKMKLIVEELGYRLQRGEEPSAESLAARFPELDPALLARELEYQRNGVEIDSSANVSATRDTRQPTGAASPDDASELETPLRQIGKYRVNGVLGEGVFGRVYLGRDETLRRDLAIKVPHTHQIERPGYVENYLREARVVAKLDHPGIVPVYEFDEDDGRCFVVSKLIQGGNLASRIEIARPSHAQAAAWVAEVAEALHYAHSQEVVHRDIKPENLLLDKDDKIYVTDFGLALKDEDFGSGSSYVGSPAYMSPEQARGESDLVNGCSDIFSLGTVLYLLLCGQLPFRGRNTQEVLENIIYARPKPPRQRDDTIPKELERICLKALAKRPEDRYLTATDLAEDLRAYLAAAAASGSGGVESASASGIDTGRRVKIVPKGLRAFDARDSRFFLDLLPGPRDEEGLPESIRFWKNRIEEDSEDTFRVGLVFGPSGCGKTSFVNAGLLPRLSQNVTSVYVECTADDTEDRLLRGLHRQCLAHAEGMGLCETVVKLLGSGAIRSGTKVLIVLDQFEQWLHATPPDGQSRLVETLRACDGRRLQCLLMVRDEFWLAITRFMGELDVPLLQGQNSALVDLFDPFHARAVLSEFGRAYGRLPETAEELTDGQRRFLDDAVRQLAENDKVVPVRLALFAEMVRGKPWTAETLRSIGGTEGVGVTFLEETFNAANLSLRRHQRAARSVLKTLLPETGQQIKGNMKSDDELYAVSGYTRRRDFDDLVRVLNDDARLVTPTDPEGADLEEIPSSEPSEKYYQLTHDYLVPSIRRWLARKQRETRRGRAEMRLADRAASWNVRPEPRQLPTPWEFANARLLTRPSNWSDRETRLMRAAGRYYRIRGLLAVVACLVLAWAAWEGLGVMRANSLIASLRSAQLSEVPSIIDRMKPVRRWVVPRLENETDRLPVSLARLSFDEREIDNVVKALLGAEPSEVGVICRELKRHCGRSRACRDHMRRTFHAAQGPEILRAASGMAALEPESVSERAEQVAEQLVIVRPSELADWREALRDSGNVLSPLLLEFYRDLQRDTVQRLLAAEVLEDFAKQDVAVLAEAIQYADSDEEVRLLIDRLIDDEDAAITELGSFLQSSPDDEEDKDLVARRRANAGAALLRLESPTEVWQLLRHGPDPRVQTELIHRVAAFEVPHDLLSKMLEQKPDPDVRQALILCLGELVEAEQVPSTTQLAKRVREDHWSDPDAGVHAAARWLVGLCERADKVGVATAGEQASDVEVPDLPRKRQWYTTVNDHTMVYVRGGEFRMGSPDDDDERLENEEMRDIRALPFLIADAPVTIGQYRLFLDENQGQGLRNMVEYAIEKGYSGPEDTDNSPIIGVTWNEATAYCNWLTRKLGLDEDQCCYEMNDGVMRPKANHRRLRGFRLPTEIEWEFACRAGTTTRRFFGDSSEHLAKYGWYRSNSPKSTRAIGRLKPNRFGLSDMYGNVWEWCQNLFVTDMSRSDPRRALRGGSFSQSADALRSAQRFSAFPNNKIAGYYGLRVARTWRGTDMIPLGSTWSYQTGRNGLPPDWHEVDFDDTSWPKGPAPLGYGPNQHSTVISYGDDPGHKYSTAYFRIRFDGEGLAEAEMVHLHLQCDDGAAVYLNGTEIGRYNLEPGSEWAVHGTDSFQEHHLFLSTDVRRRIGPQNLLAVEVHQYESRSRDLHFDLRLTRYRLGDEE